MTRRPGPSALTAVAALVLAASCSFGPMSSAGGPSAGAKTGGAQDLSLMRAKVDAGIVPSVEDLPFEGLYAEHDLPVDGATCSEVFCVRAGTGLTDEVLPPLADGGTLDGSLDGGAPALSAAWVHLGLSSNVDLTTFHRTALNAAVVIDHSGSMSGDKLAAVKAAAEKLVDQLGEGDLFALVQFDQTSQTLVSPTPVTDRERLKATIRAIPEGGSTCLECGLKDGFAAARQHLDASRSARVFLFTDEQPNVGATGADAFSTLLENNATDGIGTTLFGVGLDFGQRLAEQVMAVRGANYVYLATIEQIRAVFDKDFDFLVTPVAYDLHLKFDPASGATFGALYGAPGTAEGALDSRVATVFLSRTHSAMVARFAGGAADRPLGTAALSFTTTDGAARTAELEVAAPSSGPPSFAGVGTRKAVALTRYLLGLRLACQRSAEGDRPGALDAGKATAAFIRREADVLDDAGLRREADLAAALEALLGR